MLFCVLRWMRNGSRLNFCPSCPLVLCSGHVHCPTNRVASGASMRRLRRKTRLSHHPSNPPMYTRLVHKPLPCAVFWIAGAMIPRPRIPSWSSIGRPSIPCPGLRLCLESAMEWGPRLWRPLAQLGVLLSPYQCDLCEYRAIE